MHGVGNRSDELAGKDDRAARSVFTHAQRKQRRRRYSGTWLLLIQYIQFDMMMDLFRRIYFDLGFHNLRQGDSFIKEH